MIGELGKCLTLLCGMVMVRLLGNMTRFGMAMVRMVMQEQEVILCCQVSWAGATLASVCA